MRISIAAGPWLPVPPIEGGSTGRIWQGLAEQFAKAGHTVTLLCKEHPQQQKEEVYRGVRYYRSGGAKQSGYIALDLIKDFFYATKVLRELPPADITIFHDFWLPALSSLRKQTLGKTIVFVGRIPKGQFFLYGGVDAFVVASEVVREKILLEQSQFQDKISLIPCPVEDAFFCKSNGNVKDVVKSLLYVGRIHPEKGLELLINAFVKLHRDYPEMTLDIVGPVKRSEGGGGEEFSRKLQHLAGDAAVIFHPPEYDPAKLAQHYQGSDIFVYPSLAEEGETFGVAPLEAMAAGIVPVVSDLECFRGHIKHMSNGIVFSSANSVETLSASLKLLRENATLTERLAKQASHDAVDYRYDTIARFYIELFEKLVE